MRINRLTLDLQKSFVLHTRPYRDTSLLVDLFTEAHGILRGIARGVKKNKSETRGLLLPFIPLAISGVAKTELLNISKVDVPRAAACNLSGSAILCGFYLNELLIKFLYPHDAHPKLFHGYAATLDKLKNLNQSDQFAKQLALRSFEKLLLKEIGYELYLNKDARGKPIDAGLNYYYKIGVGFLPGFSDERAVDDSMPITSGKTLNALREDALSFPAEFREAKLLLRYVINSLLSSPLKSRDLFLRC